jgi:glycosyltransferase involved in cell wall biosynthesis
VVMGRTIHQLVHTLSYGDAISTEVLALQRALQGLGCRSEIFRIHEHPRLQDRSQPYAALANESEGELILHYSLGSPLNDVYASWRGGRRRLIYHNITPAGWYRSINQRVSDDIERGLAELPRLCGLSDALWADSPFNARELATLGYAAEVLDLPVDPGRWDAPRNEALYSSVVSASGTQVLHVGRLAPNKCVEDVIKCFYFLVKYIDPQARLRLVGIDTDTELYSFSLRELANYLGIGYAVEFVGALADDEVRALYEASDVYLCMSEHEGFCLPLIEAMHFKLPVIAFGAGAVPDTVGDGGVLVREKRHADVACLMAKLAQQGEMREAVVSAGVRRVEQFSYERFVARVRALLESESSSVTRGEVA